MKRRWILLIFAFVAVPSCRSSAVTEVAAGRGSSCAIVGDGDVYCWGANTFGQLGDGTTVHHSTPVAISSLSSAVAVRVGDDHACALLANGTVQCWGSNAAGQLGDGTTTNRSLPAVVTGLDGVTSLAAGRSHTCAVVAGGEVRCWGQNDRGQLGNATTANSATPVTVLGLTGATQVAAADAFHTCALVSGGAVRCWGWDHVGQLGTGVQNDPYDPDRHSSTPVAVVGITGATKIAVTGAGNACALLTGGEVRCWGWNTFGQLGQGGDAPPGDVLNRVHSATPLTVKGLSGVTALAETSGTGQVCAIVTGGRLRCWGHNGLGQLGDGSNAHQPLPVDVPGLAHVSFVAGGADHTCAIAEGQVACWGFNNEGQLGDGFTIDRPTPVAVEFAERPYRASPAEVRGVSGAVAIGAGALHACALLGRGEVACWGYNGRGQLGNGAFTVSTEPTPAAIVSGLSGAIAIAAGSDHTCAIVAGGEVRCWGWNASGQLGDGTYTNRPVPVPVSGLSGATAIAAGRNHTCAVVSGGAVRCWGNNYVAGPLGVQPGAQGGAIAHPVPVTVGGGLTGATGVAIRGGHTCAIVAGGEVRCWGWGFEGQLGKGTSPPLAGPNPATAQGLSGAVALAAGEDHTCAVLSDGEARCWGQNTFGKVGDGTTTNRFAPVPVSGLSGVIAIGAGEDHSCAIVAGGEVRCWGWNASGQLGDFTTVDRATPVPVPGISATAIAAGWRNTCAIVSDGTVRCWGLRTTSIR